MAALAANPGLNQNTTASEPRDWRGTEVSG